MENSATPAADLPQDRNDRIATDLYEKGWSVLPGYFDPVLVGLLSARLAGLDNADALTPAGIGRLDDNQIAPEIRKDKTFWLNRAHETDRAYLMLMEELRLVLNRRLFLGLFEFEAHYALYPPGGFYKKHLDALKGEKNRIVSTVFYLNDDWQDGDGGELLIYSEKNVKQAVCKVAPLAGTFVLFLSEDTPHEVLISHKDRKSIAGWFRCNSSSAEKADPLR